MARVTVEDCIDKITNRFELVMIASQRARKISSGAALNVDRDNDKNPVVALREIAAEKLDLDALKEDLIRSHQRMAIYEEDDDSIDLMDGEEEWGSMSRDSDDEDDAASAGAEGIYSDEDITEEDENPKSGLADMAGGA